MGGARLRRDVRAKGAGGMAMDDGARGWVVRQSTEPWCRGHVASGPSAVSSLVCVEGECMPDACIGGLGAAGCGRSGAGSCKVAWRWGGGGVGLTGRPWGAGSVPLRGRHTDGAWDTPRMRDT